MIEVKEGGPDEAWPSSRNCCRIDQTAERHQLEVLGHLLGMAQLEAEERLRLRSKRKLS